MSGTQEKAAPPQTRLPISAAKSVATAHNLRQVILLAWDGELTHVVTYGKSADDCAQAAQGGNLLKEKWGWPECNDQPSRVKKLEAVNKELLEALDEIRVTAFTFAGSPSEEAHALRGIERTAKALIAKARGR